MNARATAGLLVSLLVPVDAMAAASTHVLYLNDCKPSGCVLTPGTTDSSTGHTSVITSQHTLGAFAQTDDVWNQSVACIRHVLSSYDIQITEAKPASGDWIQIDIAGTASDLALQETLALSDVSCPQTGNCSGAMVPREIAFAFANDSAVLGKPDQICWAATQAIAQSWAIDHVVDAADAMTYNSFSGIREFHDGEACGSDCSNGTSPFGYPCTGSGGTATHVCFENGAATQDEKQLILALFGPSAPSVALTAPLDGAQVAASFPITATCVSSSGAATVSVLIDSGAAIVLDTVPYQTTAPASLTPGTHVIAASCSTALGGEASAPSVTVDLVAPATGGGKHSCGCDLSDEPEPLAAIAASVAGLIALVARRRRRL